MESWPLMYVVVIRESMNIQTNTFIIFFYKHQLYLMGVL